MRAALRLAALIDGFNQRLGRAVSLLALLMVGFGAWNALARWSGRWLGTDLSSNGLIEAQWYLFSVLFLLGAGYTLSRDEHVRVDVLYGRLGPRGKAAIDLAGALLLLLPFCVFGVVFTWPVVQQSWSVRELSPDPGGLPRYPLKALMPAAFALLGVQGVSSVIHSAATLLGEGAGRE